MEKELLSILWSLKQLRSYLLGRQFYIITDHQPLKCLFNHKNLSSRVMRWRLTMEEYEFEIIYKPRVLNTNAKYYKLKKKQVILYKTYEEHMEYIKKNIIQNSNITEVSGDNFDDEQS